MTVALPSNEGTNALTVSAATEGGTTSREASNSTGRKRDVIDGDAIPTALTTTDREKGREARRKVVL